MDPRAEVKNAADAQQVKGAGRRESRREQRRLAAYRAVMTTSAGRAVMWDLIGRAGVFRSVFNPHDGVQSFNIGRQDFGHELMGLLLRIDGEGQLYLRMETEARAQEGRDAHETDAAQVAAAGDEERT